MARYDITSLNYINVGSNRVFLNFDSLVSYPLKREIHNLLSEHDENTLIGTNINLNEDISKLITEDSKLLKTETNLYLLIVEHNTIHYYKPDGIHTIFSPILSNDTDTFVQNIDIFNKRRITLNNTYVGESFLTNNKNNFNVLNTTYTPIYDIKDISIKSVQNIFYRNTKIDAEDTYMNIYAPELTSNPVEFCQINYGVVGDTFLLTPITKSNTYKLTSSLLQTKINNKYNDRYTIYHDMLFESERNELLLYSSLPLSGYETFSDILSTCNVNPILIFEPKKSIYNIQKNYIIRFPITDIITDYDHGNVHGDIYPCKNHLNSTYDIDINDYQLNNNRQYCGLNKSGNVIYLKYYDNINYNLILDGVENGLSVLNAVENPTNVFPYQKIENFKRTTFSNRRLHKSNLFSVKINDLVDILDKTEKENNTKSKIREEIYLAIQDIVKNVCPVNTQLFKVYFGN